MPSCSPSASKTDSSLPERVLAGERLALARLLSQVENDTPAGRDALDLLFAHTGRAHLIGVTGSPGAGKSSLVNQVARALRRPADGQPERTVAILAVDPTSPFSGGALLGDRVRMRDLSGDPGVFIRSMATRGALGGLARTTASAVQALDAAGFDVVLIETVGAGQSEVDIARLAHTTIVVEAPGMGDDIQAIKAGILEIADILVVNKADRPGVENTERALKAMLELGQPQARPAGKHSRESAHASPTEHVIGGWTPIVLRAVATESEGIAALVTAIEQHRDYLLRTGEWQRRERDRLRNELDHLLQAALLQRWQDETTSEKVAQVEEDLFRRQVSPFQAVCRLLDATEPKRIHSPAAPE